MIAIFSKSLPNDCIEKIIDFINELINRKIDFTLYQPFFETLKSSGLNIECQCFNNHFDLPKETELFLSIGGDGTILEAVTILKDCKIPLAGFNTGRIGFLADFSLENASQTVEILSNKNYKQQSRSLLQISSENFTIPTCNLAFNDFTIQKHERTKLIGIKVSVNDQYLNTYWGDGIIISTATGSTAYSLSVGGPILMPESKNLIISPIASHNLSVRPIVLEENSVIKITANCRQETVIASLDGRFFEAPSQTTFKIESAKFQIIMAQLPNFDFFSTLRNKLLWGKDIRNTFENCF